MFLYFFKISAFTYIKSAFNILTLLVYDIWSKHVVDYNPPPNVLHTIT